MIEEKLERIAVALEAIAARRIMGEQAVEGLRPLEAKEATCVGESQKRDSKDEKEPELRENLKAALAVLGVPFNVAARLPTLQKLHDDAVEKLRLRQAAIEVNEGDPIVPAKDVTREMVRNSLVSLAAAMGKDVPLGIIKTYGKKEKLSDVDPKYYADIIEACRAAECKDKGEE